MISFKPRPKKPDVILTLSMAALIGVEIFGVGLTFLGGVAVGFASAVGLVPWLFRFVDWEVRRAIHDD